MSLWKVNPFTEIIAEVLGRYPLFDRRLWGQVGGVARRFGYGPRIRALDSLTKRTRRIRNRLCRQVTSVSPHLSC